MSYDEQPDDDSFDAVIRNYAQACIHQNAAGMREGYIKLREMCSPSVAQPSPEPGAREALRELVALEDMRLRLRLERPSIFDLGRGYMPNMRREYNSRILGAWARARAVLFTAPDTGTAA